MYVVSLLFQLKKLGYICKLKGKSQKIGSGETAGEGGVFDGTRAWKWQELTGQDQPLM